MVDIDPRRLAVFQASLISLTEEVRVMLEEAVSKGDCKVVSDKFDVWETNRQTLGSKK